MERKSWPWRKKTEKSMSPAFASSADNHAPDAPQTVFVEQETSIISVDNAQLLQEVLQREQAEEKVKNLTEKIVSISADLAVKEEQVKQHAKVARDVVADALAMDEQVKQHAKIAKDAVAGREKAEAEARALKQQLEVSSQQKSAADARIHHLDGALKECMKQVRSVREEQERKLHDTILARSREWDKIRAEMEAKHAELRRQVLESGAENSAMSKSLQERAKSIVEITEAKSRAETEVKVQQVKIETMEKEINALKYDLHVLNKELEIRNEEKEYSRKASDAAHKQYLESVKKIAKLDSECQRLRLLIRKKLPGPAALAQMRMEVDHVGRETLDGRRRKSLSKNVQNSTDQVQENLRVNAAAKEVEVLTDRLMSMDDETKLLKEVLAKRTSELQAARLMCARTASKLSSAQGQLEEANFSRGQELPNGVRNSNHDLHTRDGSMSWAETSEDGRNDDEVSCAESWASALITELSHLKKDEGVPNTRQSLGSSSSNCKPTDNIESVAVEEQIVTDENSIQEVSTPAKDDAIRESELQAANIMCKNVSSKLASVEEQLRALKSNSEAPAVEQIQECLSRILEVREEFCKLDQSLDEELRRAVGGTKLGADDLLSCDATSNANSNAADCESVAASTQLCTVDTGVLCKIVEALISAGENEMVLKAPGQGEGQQADLQSSELQTRVQSLIALKERLVVQGTLDDAIAAAVLSQVAAVFSGLSRVDPSKIGSILQFNSCFSNNNNNNNPDEVLKDNPETEVVEEEESQILKDREDGEKEAERLDHSEDDQALNVAAKSEDEALNAAAKSELLSKQLDCLQSELDQVKEEKAEMEQQLRTANEELQSSKAKLLETEQMVTDLEARLSDVEEAKEKAGKEAADMASNLKADSESKLQDAQQQIGKMQDKVAALETELEEQGRRYAEATARCQDLEQQLKSGAMKASTVADEQEPKQASSRRSVDDEEARLRKEREVASAKAKLAECQRTILVLGNQLKALSSPRDSMEVSFDSSLDSPASTDHKNLPLATHADMEEDLWDNNYHHHAHHHHPPPHRERRRPNSGLVRTRDGRLISQEQFWSSSSGSAAAGYVSGPMDPHADLSSSTIAGGHQHRAPQNIGNHFSQYGSFMPQSPLHEYNNNNAADGGSPYMYSPPETAMSSPARSPARFLELGSRRRSSSGSNGVRTSLMKSMNKAASSSSELARPAKSVGTSSLTRFFSRAKNQH